MASGCLLGEHQAVIDGHFKEPTRSLEQADLCVRIGLLDLGRQTGGSGFVVSDDAVLDRDMHEGTGALRQCITAANRSDGERRCQGDEVDMMPLLVSLSLLPYLFDPC
jgi:hypothetical protein